ncbi:MAG TPA: hypothetical protein DCS43_00295, partial [Verrucomicrobia bacterium]|nr:hypothetical protein [Verrucomicrobiota bacterium]
NPLYPSNKLGLCVMWRRSVWDAIGEFDPKCDFAEDYDYWLRVQRRFKLAKCTDRSLLNFRYHEAQNSQSGERRQLRNVRRALFKQRWMDVRERPWSGCRWWRLARSTGAWGRELG